MKENNGILKNGLSQFKLISVAVALNINVLEHGHMVGR